MADGGAPGDQAREVMAHARLRWTLPLLHTAIDAVLLAALVYMTGPRTRWRQDYRPMTELDAELWREAPTPQPLAAIALGTPPAGLAATLVIPNWRRSTPFDYRWAGLHVSLAMLFWSYAGRFGESAGAGLRRLMVGYAFARAAFAPLSLGDSVWSSIASVALAAVWLAVALLGVGRLMRAVIRKVSPG